jgi:outer membrane cobalamin receptor
LIGNSLLAGLALTGAALHVAPAAGESQSSSIEEIQATATRRPADLHDVSAALSIISSDAMYGIKLTTDAIAAQT